MDTVLLKLGTLDEARGRGPAGWAPGRQAAAVAASAAAGGPHDTSHHQCCFFHVARLLARSAQQCGQCFVIAVKIAFFVVSHLARATGARLVSDSRNSLPKSIRQTTSHTDAELWSQQRAGTAECE